MVLFGTVLAAILASAVITNRQVRYAMDQESLADTIVQGVGELSFLASDYVIYREAPQLERWEARFASFVRDVSRLQAEDPEVAADLAEFREQMARLHDGQVESPLRWEARLQVDGNEDVVHVALAATVAYTSTGEFEALRWLLRDVTREKQMHAALVHAGKLSIAGRLAASLAHEINNPLSAALGCADLAMESFQAGEDPSPHLRVLCDALGRTSRVVTQLRELHGEQRVEEKRSADLNKLVENVLLLARKKAESAGVKISWEPVADLPRPAIMLDSMQQVFLNLTLNAIEAMDGHGRLDVRFRRAQHPERVGVAFTDNGPGIAAEVLEALFEPFNTTKARGSGLGLFISQNIVQQHGGSIEVQTLAGEGTTFTVWLPL